MQWHYLEAGVARGPASHEELLTLFREQRLPKTTLVWREGMDAWRPAAEMGLLPPEPPPLPGGERDLGPAQQLPPPRPASGTMRGAVEDGIAWRRYLARLLDGFLFASIGAILLSAFSVEVAQQVRELGGLAVGLIMLAVFVPVEAWFLSLDGTTPGKRMFALRVRRADGGVPSFGQALARSWRVYLLGQAAGVPILTQLVKLLALQRLQRTGQTLWDEQVGTQVEAAELSPVRRFAAGAILVFFVVMILLAQLAGP